jgi:hypothetical protein
MTEKDSRNEIKKYKEKTERGLVKIGERLTNAEFRCKWNAMISRWRLCVQFRTVFLSAEDRNEK